MTQQSSQRLMIRFHPCWRRACDQRPGRVVGPPGTLILFDNNCIHRATVPRTRHRDAVILNFRPSHERVRPFIAASHTGSWSYNAKQWIPEVVDFAAAR